ncbi:UL36 very large tegument protein [Streptomyces sp. NPDC001728]|uniref:UL36 very large tegument protein n=1 Tax=Streptomyces sp. NPDC001728 TaxID=3154396 RepID=UPI0033328FED
MTVSQLSLEITEFREWLIELVERLAPGRGWYGVFSARDPEGMRACFDGAELLPWDVVGSLLQDAGEPGDGPCAVRGGALYAAATGAHDRGPGGAAALAERRDLMERARRDAEARARELDARLHATPAPGPAETARLEHDLAWTRDDRARAAARVDELTSRLVRLGPSSSSSVTPGEGHPATAAPVAAASASVARPFGAGRRPRGARYAWLEGGAEEPGPVGAAAGSVPVPAPMPVPLLPAGGAPPRGARFGGATGRGAVRPPAGTRAAVPAADPGAGSGVSRVADSGAYSGAYSRADPGEASAPDPVQDARAAANAVYALRRLRAQGRTGEAHALLCEALGGPAARLPALAAELHRAGLGADWSTLLWEAASLPPGRLAAVAGALADAGRAADCERLLRQGVARPVEELAGACAALRAEDHHREARALLTAFVRVRAPGDAARLAGADPRGLVPQLLEAARGVSVARERDLRHAFRVAGLAGA